MKKYTIGGHLLRNLTQKDEKTIVGEVTHKYNLDGWETTTWELADKDYYTSRLGEAWDIDLNE